MSKMILNGRQYLNGTSNFYDCKGVFIDTDTVIVDKTTFTSSLSYTASQDCYIRLYLVTQQGQVINILIDGEDAGLVYFAGTMGMPVFYYLKKGQTIAISNANSSTSSSYIVYGVQQGSAVSIQPMIYSDEEREIGVWRDGKPLYQKTINIAPLPNNTTTEFALDVDTERIISMQGYGYANGDSNKWNIFINDVVPGNVRASIRVYASMTDKKLYVISGENVSVYTEAYVTIYYTKTTDTAGSGTYTPSGALATHYSSTEHIVGTWYDGKTLYEKTVHIANYSPRSAIQSFAHGVANIDNGWVTEAIKIRNLSSAGSEADDVSKNITGNDVYGYNVTSNVVRSQVWGVGSEYIYVRNGGSNTSSDAYDVYVTIRYTKTN